MASAISVPKISRTNRKRPYCRSTKKERRIYTRMIFVDLDYDRVPRDLIWWALRKKNIPEAYITIIQDMCKATTTRVKTRCGLTQYFNIEVGLHQGSTLSPLLFNIVMDMLADMPPGTYPIWIFAVFEMIRPYHVVIRILGKLLKSNL